MLMYFIKNQMQHVGIMRGTMPRQDQYQQKAHKHKIHTCPFSCLLNSSGDMNSAAHSDVTGRQQKEFCGSRIDTVAEVEFSEHNPPLGFSVRAIMQLKYIPAGEEFSH